MELSHLFDFKITSCVEIKEGFSVDRKFIINDMYLVRVINDDRVERFKFVFQVQSKFNQVSLSQKVYDFIIGSPFSYYITEYLPGENGLEVISRFNDKLQYEFGVLAGKELTKFHKQNTVPEFDTKKSVESYFESKVKIAQEGGVSDMLPILDEMIEVVRKNMHVLYNLEGVMTHSDYHLFNMIFDQEKYMGVIDFERCRIGHFLTDFRNNTPHNSPISPQFASGYIDGYLDEIYIEDFFSKYNVNDLMVAIAAPLWIKEFNPENLEKDLAFISELFESIKDVSKRPSWYIGRY